MNLLPLEFRLCLKTITPIAKNKKARLMWKKKMNNADILSNSISHDSFIPFVPLRFSLFQKKKNN